MNREIKFKCWDTDNQCFIDPSRHPISDISNNYAGLGSRYVYPQFTGLKDKNGVEIYEGDISMPGKGEIFWDEKRSMFKVRWHDKTWKETRTGIRSGKDSLYEGSEPLLTNEFAFGVVGNIYENPELLKD